MNGRFAGDKFGGRRRTGLIVLKKTEDFDGVQCEACHGAGGDFKKMSIMKDVEAAKAKGLVIPTQETCNGCHTGEDHAKKIVLADNLDNKSAIHEFKNPPAE